MALPAAEITLIGLPWSTLFVQRFSQYCDRWLEFPGCPGIPEVPLVPQRVVSFLAQAQQCPFDLVLQLHGSGTYINSFVMLLGATNAAGFYPMGDYCPDPDRFLPYPEVESEVWRHLRLMEFLGISLQGDYLEFPLKSSDWRIWNAIADAYGLKPGTYACIHPGASVSDRRWPAQHFAAVADALAAQGMPIVLTGTQAERELTQTVAEAMRFPAINLAGQTDLGTIATLLKQSILLICNDTGISHLAAALQVNSVVIFSNSEVHRWAPGDRRRHRVVKVMATQDSQPDPLESVMDEPTAVNRVIDEALELLQQEFAYAG
jgi:ADP-heptose:LPS heptosyltransferase